MRFSRSRSLQAFAWLVFLFLLFPRRVEAYLDPGSGSLIIQGLIAAFFAVSLALKLFWKKIRAFFGFSDDPSQPPDPES